MESFAEIVPQVVLRIFTPLLCFSLAAWVVLQLPSVKSRKWSKHGKSAFVGLVSLAIVCTALSDKNTNGVNGVGGMYLMQFNPPLIQFVTPEDISNGWRVAEVSDAGAFAPPPANAVTNERWRLRGAHDDAFRIPAVGWDYPFASGVTVLSRGEIRTSIHTHDFPPAFDQGLSQLPVSRRPLLPEGRRESLFWYGATPSNTLLVTWWDFALGRCAANPVRFQSELFPNGGFDYRYEDRTVRHVRVWPFDLDDDGLENSVDPDPLVAGLDAHGTNAEWYNVVCSNVLEAVEGEGGASGTPRPTLSWLEGVNSNAYYFVDVVASNGPAPIYFTGDRESRLGNPVVVALGGETNNVTLLIGINYAVTSPVPISVSLPSDGFATITTNGVSNYEVCWPLEFSVSPNGNGYRVSAVPYDPGCEFLWDQPTRSVTCNYTTDGGWIGFNCNGTGGCECDGCSVTGVAMLEEVAFDLPDVWCGCWHYDPLDPGTGPTFTNVPYVAVSFDKSVVFYEDAYTNAPNEVVAKHSTNTTLTVFAYGGDAGGMLYVSEHNIGKFVRTGGKAISFPYTAFVPPQSGVSFSIEYEAETYSDSEGDITVTASITPGDGGANISASATTTVVKVLLEAQIPSVFNSNRSRHHYGVREIVMCQHEPSSINVTWEATNGQVVKQNGALWHFQAPLFAMDCGLSIRAGVNDRYFPSVSIEEPTGFSCARATIIESRLGTNVAGGAGMSLELYITPTNVCFGNIAMEEVPTDTGLVGGYFENEEFWPYWAHTRDRRAGYWKNIGNDNLFLMEDEAIMDEELPPMAPDGTLTNDVSFGWRDGTIIWTIPLGWNEHGTSGEADPAKTNAVPEHQTFVITPDGTLTVAKAGYCASRGTNTQTRIWEVAR